LVKEGFLNTIASYLGLILGFLNILVLQPIILEPEQIGFFRIVYSTSLLIGTIFPLGLTGVIIKFLPGYKSEPASRTAFFKLIFLYSFLTYLLYLFLHSLGADSFFFNSSKGSVFEEYSQLVLPLSFFIGVGNLITVYLYGIGFSFKAVIINEIFNRLLFIAELFLYKYAVIDAEQLIYLFVFNYVIQFVLLWFSMGISVPGIIGVKISRFFSGIMLMDMWRFSFWISVVAISNMAMKNLDVIILGKIEGDYFTGIYAIALVLSGLMEVPANALSKIVDSKISDRLHHNDKEGIRRLYYDSTSMLFIAGVFSFLAMWIFLPFGISFLPEKYAGCETPVRILMIGAFSNMATGLNSILVFYDKKVKNGVVLMSFMLVFQYLISYNLTKGYGIVGICWATSITILCFNLFKSLIIWHSYRLFPFNFHYLFIFLLLGLMLGFHEFLDVDLLTLQLIEFVCFSGLIFFLVKKFKFVDGIDSILSGFKKNESK